MKIINSDIPDIKIIEPTKFEDSRGFFMESFRRDWFKDNIANYDFVQENHSKSIWCFKSRITRYLILKGN